MRTSIIIAVLLYIVLMGSLVSVAFAGGKTSISVGAGWNGNMTGSSVPWDNGGGVGAYFQLAHEWALSERTSVVAQWTHLSQWDVGPPFNDINESSVDHLGVAMKWTF